MKKNFVFLITLLALASVVFANSFIHFNNESPKNNFESVSFKIKGTGSKNIAVPIGIGSQPGNGACCSTVSPFTTASFVGNVGDVVYDGKTRRVIIKIYRDLNGTTIDLSQYY